MSYSNEWQPSNPQQGPKIGPGVRLGPMTLADVLDGAFALLRANWKQISSSVLIYSAPLALLLGLIVGLLSMDSDGVTGQPGLFTAVGTGAGLGVLILVYVIQLIYTVLAYPLLAGTITRVATASYLGRPMSASAAFSGVKRLWLPLIGASILAGLATFVGLMFCILPGIALWTMYAAIVPIIAVEEKGAIDSLARSWKLMSSRFWVYLGTLLLAGIVCSIMGYVLQLPFTILYFVFTEVGVSFLAGIFYGISNVVSSLLVIPFTALISLLLYFDARVRTEGFDVQVLASGAGDQPPPQR